MSEDGGDPKGKSTTAGPCGSGRRPHGQPALEGLRAVASTLEGLGAVDRYASVLAQLSSPTYEAFVQQINSSLEAARAAMAGLADPTRHISGQFMALDALDWANGALARQLAHTNALGSQLYDAIKDSEQWQNRLRAMLPTEESVLPILQSHVATMMEYTSLAQQSLSLVAWGTMGDALRVQESTRRALQSRFLSFGKSYSALVSSWADHPHRMLSMPPMLSSLPPIECFSFTELLRTTTVQPREVDFGERARAGREKATKAAEYELDVPLAAIDPGLPRLLHGAEGALRSENPDKVRHFGSSLRELFTHVLHTLAPDPEIIEWTSDPKDFEKGKPTRRARLRYICRGVNHAKLTVYVGKEVDSTLAFLDLFQYATHEIEADLTPEQLECMLLKMKLTIRYLVEVGRLNDRC